MAIPTPTPPPPPPVQTCILKVGIKCCKGCQTIAKRKLLNIPGVSTVEYKEEQGLLIISGDVNPTTLVHKLAKWGKHAEIISVKNQTNDNNNLGDSFSPNQSQEHNHQEKTIEKKGLIKSFLLACFGKRTSKAKVEPVRETPTIYPPPPQPIHGFSPLQIPYPPPYFGAGQSPQPQPLPPPHNGGMFRSSPPPSTPYFQSRQMQMRVTPPPSPPYFQSRQMQFPHMVGQRQHYPGY